MFAETEQVQDKICYHVHSFEYDDDGHGDLIKKRKKNPKQINVNRGDNKKNQTDDFESYMVNILLIYPYTGISGLLIDWLSTSSGKYLMFIQDTDTMH